MMTVESRAQSLNLVFVEEADAFAFVEPLMWPYGPFCPHCGYVGESTKVTANLERKIRRGLHKCRNCKAQFTVRGVTPFRGMRVPLSKCLHALHCFDTMPAGMSVADLAAGIDVSWPTSQKLGRVLAAASGREDFRIIANALSRLQAASDR